MLKATPEWGTVLETAPVSATVSRTEPAPRAEYSVEEYSTNGLFCSECMRLGLQEPQRNTPGGPTCKFGHGGAKGVEPDLGAPKLPPAVRNSPTSVMAAEGMSRDRIRSDELLVFMMVQASSSGLTDDDLEVLTGLSHQTVSARRNGLVSKKKLRNSGLLRKTRSNSPAIVWIVGEGMAVKGSPNRRMPTRPDSVELRAAAAMLGGCSDAMERVRVWLLALAES